VSTPAVRDSRYELNDSQDAFRFRPAVRNRLIFHQASEESVRYSRRPDKAMLSTPLVAGPCVGPLFAISVVPPPWLLTYAHNCGYTDNGHMIIIAKEVWDVPRGDGTGPAGFGPMTGRAAGYCAGYDIPARTGAGRGRGHRRMYYSTGMPGWMRYGCPGSAPFPVGGFRGASQESRHADDVQGMSAEREKELLGQQAQFLRSELEIVERRLNDLAGLGRNPEQGSTEGGE